MSWKAAFWTLKHDDISFRRTRDPKPTPGHREVDWHEFPCLPLL